MRRTIMSQEVRKHIVSYTYKKPNGFLEEKHMEVPSFRAAMELANKLVQKSNENNMLGKPIVEEMY